MKTRNGFVSNSSSSSFVVILPKRPSTVEELKDMFFGKLELDRKLYAGWDTDYEHGHTVKDLSEQMFKDFVRRNPHSMTLEDIGESMESLYCWCQHKNSFGMNNDGHYISDYGWMYRFDSPFFGSDQDLTNQLQKLEEDDDAMNTRHREAEHKYIADILTKRGIPHVEYGEPGGQEYYKHWSKLNDTAYKSHMGMKRLHAKHTKESQDHWKKLHELRTKVGLADAKAVLEIYPDRFICQFEYGDNHGDDVPAGMGAVLENSRDIWHRNPTIRLNHH